MAILMLLLTRSIVSLLFSLSLASTFITHALLPLTSFLWARCGRMMTHFSVCMWVCIFVTGSSPVKSHPRNECKQTERCRLPFTTGNKSRSSLRKSIQLRARCSLSLTRQWTLTVLELHFILQGEGRTSCCYQNRRTLRRFLNTALFQAEK